MLGGIAACPSFANALTLELADFLVKSDVNISASVGRTVSVVLLECLVVT